MMKLMTPDDEVRVYATSSAVIRASSALMARLLRAISRRRPASLLPTHFRGRPGGTGNCLASPSGIAGQKEQSKQCPHLWDSHALGEATLPRRLVSEDRSMRAVLREAASAWHRHESLVMNVTTSGSIGQHQRVPAGPRLGVPLPPIQEGGRPHHTRSPNE
jgi:hypothetical protein